MTTSEDEPMPDTEPARNQSRPYLWAEELAEQRAWVLHAPSRTVSRVKSFYDGVARVYVSPQNDKPLRGAALELEDGNVLVAAEGVFFPLSDKEVQFFQAAQKTIGLATKAAADAGAAMGMTKATGMMLIAVALRATASVADGVSRQGG